MKHFAEFVRTGRNVSSETTLQPTIEKDENRTGQFRKDSEDKYETKQECKFRSIPLVRYNEF